MSTLAERAAAPAASAPLARDQGELPRAREAPGIALAVAAVSLGVGIYLALGLGYIAYDSLSRVAQAYYVLFSRNPHLAAIGFVWNPLPSLLELPLVALKGWWPALATQALAGVFVSAGFAGVAAYFLLQILALFGLPRPWRLALAALFLLNPLILLYAANGMTEIMLIAAMLASLDGLLRYLRGHVLRGLVSAAVWLAIGFGVRYETVAFAALVGLGLVVASLGQGHLRQRVQGALLLWLTPVVYAACLWLYFNWLIMKDPLYFAHSAYSNAGQTAAGGYIQGYPPLASAAHHLLGAIAYAAHFTLLFWPVIVGFIAVFALLFGRRRDPVAPVLVAAALAVPALQVVMIYFGRSAGWDRFFIYYIPMGLLLLAFAWSKLAAGSRWSLAALVLTVLLVAGGDLGTLLAMKSPFLGHVDGSAVTKILAGRPFHDYTQFDDVAAYVDAHPNLVLLVDTFDAGPIVLRARNPQQFIIDSDSDYQSILSNPRGRVDAILVPSPGSAATARADAVNRQWPQMWVQGLAWAHLVKQFAGADHYRLFAVGPRAP